MHVAIIITSASKIRKTVSTQTLLSALFEIKELLFKKLTSIWRDKSVTHFKLAMSQRRPETLPVIVTVTLTSGA